MSAALRLVFVSAISLGLSACGSSAVYFQEPSSVDKKGDHDTDKEVYDVSKKGGEIFNIPISKIVVTRIENKEDKNTKNIDKKNNDIVVSDYSVKVIPEPSTLNLIAIPHNDFFSKNKISIEKMADNDIPTTVSNEFSDLTKARLEAIGTVISTAVSLAATLASTEPAGPTKDNDCKYITNFFVIVDKTTPDNGEVDSCFEYKIAFKDPQLQTIKRKNFEEAYVKNKVKSDVWPVPACRDIQFTVSRKGASKIIDIPLVVADPEYLRLKPFPEKGKIAMHPICGADITDDPVDRWQIFFDSLTAATDQYKNIKKAGSQSSSGGNGGDGADK